MNAKIRRQLKDRKRKIQQRLDKTRFPQESPVLSASNIHYEIAERTRATAAGGIGVIQQMVRRLELDELLNEHLNLLKIYLPYSESDHVLNIAYNLLAGGTCLEHLELRRHDEAYLDALGASASPTRPRPATSAAASTSGRSTCCRKSSTRFARRCGGSSLIPSSAKR